MKERRAGGLGRANSFWEKKGTESPELREGKEVVGGAGGNFSRSIPKVSFPLSPIIVPSPAIGSALSIHLFLKMDI